MSKSIRTLIALSALALGCAAHAAPGYNGVKSNGAGINGFAGNGVRVNGISKNGLRYNGAYRNGVSRNGAQGSAPVADWAALAQQSLAQ